MPNYFTLRHEHSNVTSCHQLRWIMDHSILIVKKEKDEKEHAIHQREKGSKYSKKEREERGSDNATH